MSCRNHGNRRRPPLSYVAGRILALIRSRSRQSCAVTAVRSERAAWVPTTQEGGDDRGVNDDKVWWRKFENKVRVCLSYGNGRLRFFQWRYVNWHNVIEHISTEHAELTVYTYMGAVHSVTNVWCMQLKRVKFGLVLIIGLTVFSLLILLLFSNFQIGWRIVRGRSWTKTIVYSDRRNRQNITTWRKQFWTSEEKKWFHLNNFGIFFV